MKATPYVVVAGLALFAVMALLVWGYLKASSRDGGGMVEWVDVKTLQPGPIQHETLTKEQMARLEQIHQTFAEVDGFTLEKRIDDFKRDYDPDRELAIWERMA